MVYLALLEEKPFWSFNLFLLIKEVRQGLQPIEVLSVAGKEKEVELILKTSSGIKCLKVFKTIPPPKWYPISEDAVRGLKEYAVKMPVRPDLIVSFLLSKEMPQAFEWVFK